MVSHFAIPSKQHLGGGDYCMIPNGVVLAVSNPHSLRSFWFVIFSGRESKLSAPGKNNKPGIFMPGLSLR